MEISRLHVEAISAAAKPRNQMPLPLCPVAPIFLGADVTTFLHQYESVAAFTATDPSSRNVVVMLPYYCTEAIRETVMMMRGYERRDWAALKKEVLDAFRYTDSRPDSLVYTREYLENLCAEFGGREDTESLKSFLRTYDHISGVVTERGMMVEYERTEMLLRALPKPLRRKAISKLGLNPLDPRTLEYGKLKGWIAARIAAAEALTIFDFLAPAAPPLTTFPATPKTHTTFPALAISPTSIASPAPLAPTASTSSTDPTSTSAFPVSSTPASPKTHTTSPALLVFRPPPTPATPKTHTTSPASTISPASALASPAPFAPAAAETTMTIPMAAKVPSTTAIITTLPPAPSPAARQGTFRA